VLTVVNEQNEPSGFTEKFNPGINRIFTTSSHEVHNKSYPHARAVLKEYRAKSISAQAAAILFKRGSHR